MGRSPRGEHEVKVMTEGVSGSQWDDWYRLGRGVRASVDGCEG